MKAPPPDELAAIAAALRLRSAAAKHVREGSAWLADARARAVSQKPGSRDRKDAESW
jgi:hypothetical protein